MKGFIKNEELLEEDYKVKDLLGFEKEIDRLDELMQTIKYQSVIGYLGRFGTGKSTALFQLKERYEAAGDTKWFEFDAWKYPERKDLWEGFVLDIADQLDKKKRVTKKIDGDNTAVNTLGIVARIAAAIKTAGASEVVGSKLVSLFENKPIERVFQMQELLETMIRGAKERTVVISIEDIDRSGDAGCYFLETLRQFIRTKNLEKRVIILVPIGTEIYERNESFRESYHKVFDYLLYFELKNTNFDRFIAEVFDETKMPASHAKTPNQTVAVDWEGQLKDWFMCATHSKLTIREIKFIIRSASNHYASLVERGHNPHPIVMLCFTLLNHTFDKRNAGTRHILRASGGDRIISQSNSIASVSVLLQSIARGSTVTQFKSNSWVEGDIQMISEKELTVPMQFNETNRAGEGRKVVYHLSDFYLTPFGLNTEA